MQYIRVTPDNLEKENICCAISSNEDIQVKSKKSWLRERMDDGLVFLKSVERGKCFIEFIPAENAWAPIIAPDYLYIDCFWVSGKFKGHGYANDLLDQAVAECHQQNKSGLVVLSSDKKRSFLSDPDYLRHKGFVRCDSCEPYFTLMYLPLKEDAIKPKFKDCVRKPTGESGYVVYYSSQCPFNAKYAPLLPEVASRHGISLKLVEFKTTTQAQESPTPFTVFSLFRDGKLLTHEILNESRLEKLI